VPASIPVSGTGWADRWPSTVTLPLFSPKSVRQAVPSQVEAAVWPAQLTFLGCCSLVYLLLYMRWLGVVGVPFFHS